MIATLLATAVLGPPKLVAEMGAAYSAVKSAELVVTTQVRDEKETSGIRATIKVAPSKLLLVAKGKDTNGDFIAQRVVVNNDRFIEVWNEDVTTSEMEEASPPTLGYGPEVKGFMQTIGWLKGEMPIGLTFTEGPARKWNGKKWRILEARERRTEVKTTMYVDPASKLCWRTLFESKDGRQKLDIQLQSLKLNPVFPDSTFDLVLG